MLDLVLPLCCKPQTCDNFRLLRLSDRCHVSGRLVALVTLAKRRPERLTSGNRALVRLHALIDLSILSIASERRPSRCNVHPCSTALDAFCRHGCTLAGGGGGGPPRRFSSTMGCWLLTADQRPQLPELRPVRGSFVVVCGCLVNVECESMEFQCEHPGTYTPVNVSTFHLCDIRFPSSAQWAAPTFVSPPK